MSIWVKILAGTGKPISARFFSFTLDIVEMREQPTAGLINIKPMAFNQQFTERLPPLPG